VPAQYPSAVRSGAREPRGERDHEADTSCEEEASRPSGEAPARSASGASADAFPRTPGVRYGYIWWHPVEIKEHEERYLFAADLAGTEPGDVDIELMGNEVMVSGKDAGAPFAFAIALPEPVDAADVEAELDNGVLRVTAPRSASTRHRKDELKG
jgi:HSP20 family protein